MRRLVMMWTLGVVVGCVESAAVRCPDGESTCPAGTVCVIPTGAVDLAPLPVRCVAPQDLADCEGAAPACGPESARRCYPSDQGPVCLAAGCANRLPDPGEQCDDGNNNTGDGCSADCTSDETCGNGRTDAVLGEACDDGNHLGHDGCSSRCAVEAPRWAALSSDPHPAGNGAAAAFDTRRGRLVLFGGGAWVRLGAEPLVAVVSEWDGGWHRGAATLGPARRTDAAMAYDERRGVTVMFGGIARQAYADTWEWTGTSWRTTDAFGPKARSGAALVYDPVADRMVLFGGAGLDDTWALANGIWTPIASPLRPPATTPPELAFDRVAGRVVLVSGGEHWELVADAWQRVGTIPAMDEGPRLVFDPVTRQRLLLGRVGAEPAARTWTWTGQTWVDGPPGPTSDALGQVIADPSRGLLIMTNSSRSSGQLVVWDGSAWTPDAGGLGPTFATLVLAASTVDVGRHEVVVFGGDRGGGPIDQTLTFDGLRWRAATPAVAPAPRVAHAMAYDPRARQVVMFGGRDGAGVLGDTWLWDGLAWFQAQPTSSPLARAGHAMTYDPGRQRVVLFGGDDGALAARADTWEWDGATWKERDVLPPQPMRSGAKLIAEAGGSLLMFGGGAPDAVADWAAVYGDTWRLDDTGWHELAPVVAPAPRANTTLAWNAARQRVTLHGGEVLIGGGSLGTVALDDLWEWDGTLWRELTPASPIGPLSGHTTVTSIDGAGVMLLGAYALQELRWDDGDAYETCQTRVDADGDALAGCADPDCWPVCSPMCPPGLSCAPDAPRCGDLAPVCDPLESAQICEDDCGPAPVACGDLVCDATDACPSDCPAP